MTNGAVIGAASAAGAAGAITEALKAMGPIICVEPQEFLALLARTEKPLVVQSPSGFLTKYKYLTNYKGFTIFTKSKDALLIPASAEIVTAKKIWVPEM